MTILSLSAIVVNFNAGADLRLALESLRETLAGRSWEAVVVDNASIDGSAAVVGKFAPDVRLISNQTNIGFARAVNQGLAATSGRDVLLMNPDCRLTSGAVDTLAAELDRFDSCAIAGPRILNPDGSIQGSARGDPDMLTGLFGRSALVRNLFPRLSISRRNVVDVHGAADSVEVDWVSGACMLARRDALTQVGGFDERYFLYWEDADLCRRLRSRGYHIRYVPRACAIHRVGQSSRTARFPAIRAFHESAYLYYATHVAPRSASRRALARLILAARAWWQLRLTP
jgi:hypothetical protein